MIYNMHERDEKVILGYCVNQAISQRIARLAEIIQVGPKVRLPVTLMRDLEGEFVESNKKSLCDKYGLDVAKHGWQL